MIKLSPLFLFAFLFIYSTASYSQDDIDASVSRFSLIGYGSIGYAKVENDNQANYDMNANSGELLLNYKFNNMYGVFTGIAFTDLSGSGFNEESIFYHERSVLKIPIGFSITNDLSYKLKTFFSIGAFAQNIISDDYRYLDTTVKDLYAGWNFGAQFSFGITHSFDDSFSLGFLFTGQSDFSKVETTDNASFNDQQKITNLNMLGLLFIWDF
jgi:hypothetical protein